MPSVKKNFLYSSILTTANYVFPLLTYPYVSRVLGVHNMGICNFVDSIINYFVLFSMMGITSVGIREVATSKNNPHKLSSVFSSLLTLNAITTIIGLMALIVATIAVPKLQENSQLMIFGAFKLFFNLFLIEWFYKGLEDFRYVTMRTIAVKCLFVASVFIFVRDAEDYPIYYLLISLMVVVNAIINGFHSHRFVSFSFSRIELKKYLKPFFTLGIYMLLNSMYISFNVVYLGFSAGDTQVGYYTTATKLYTILIALFSAFTGVMLPRMSALISEGKFDELLAKISKSVDLIITFSIPLIISVIILAPQLIYIISGPGYEGAITPMRIIMPLTFIIGYEQILVLQTLLPLKNDKIILRNSVVGAITGVSLNILLVGALQSIGSAIVWVSCEMIILILSQVAVTRAINLRFPLRRLLKNLLFYVPLMAILPIISSIIDNQYYSLLAGGLVTLIYFYIIEFVILKNETLIILLKPLKFAQKR